MMLRRRGKTIQVELVSPQTKEHTIASNQSLSSPTTPQPNGNTEFVLKLIAALAILVQSMLATYGYSTLIGYYNTFGISPTELEISFPVLLFYGYTFAFKDTFVAAAGYPLIGPFLLALVFLLIAGGLVWVVYRAKSLESKLIWSSVFALPLILLASFPMVGIGKGLDLARDDLKAQGLVKSSGPIVKEHVIQTDQGEEKKGSLIAATSKYTFLLTDSELLKIDNRRNKVIRVTRFSTKEETPASSQQQ